MKCPKCGYNSFEFNDVCKKCTQDLTGYKLNFGLKPIVLPQETRTALATASKTEPDLEVVPQQTTESPSDIFSFDLPEEKQAASTGTINKNVGFGEPPATAMSTAYGTFSFDDEPGTNQSKAVDDAFADLMESTPFAGNDSLAEQNAVPANGTTDEYELSSFSWDEPGVMPAAEENKPADNFESLFGGTDSNTKK